MTVKEVRLKLNISKDDMTDEKLQDYLTQFQYLIDTWLDLYERKMFNGKTISEITHST